MIVPITLVAYNLADDVAPHLRAAEAAIDAGHPAAAGLAAPIPLVGGWLDHYVSSLLRSREQMTELAKRMLEPARHYLLAGGMVLGSGVAQISLAAFVSFFLYRDGHALLARDRRGRCAHLRRTRRQGVADTVSQTVRGVMYGLLGTALAQAVVAAIGFAIAGVPAVPLLAVPTFCRRWCRWARRSSGAAPPSGCSRRAFPAGASSCWCGGWS